MQKKDSNIIIFLLTLLIYFIFNVCFNIISFVFFYILSLLPSGFVHRFFLCGDIILALSVGIFLVNTLTCRFFHNSRSISISKFILGILLLINYIYFLFDFFRYHERDIISIIVILLYGIYLIVNNKNFNSDDVSR